ncbi:MAG: CRTAC1 family protein, partial [bacterium]|nr:CRTAC1 family protein [bacterium]
AVADSASGGANLVLMGQGDGSFGHDPGHPLSSVSEVRTALWGDLDNDGLTDAYLCRRGPNQLWRQEAGGEWQDVTESTGTGGGAADTVDGALWDADHDGDLDLFLVNADSPNELLNNNGDGTFRHLAEERGLTGLGLGSRRVIVADLDGDRDTDIVVVNEQTPHEVYHNDLLWQWLPAEGLSAFQESGATEVVAADTNADGRVDLVSLERDGAVRIWERSDGEWQAQTLLGAGRVVGEGAQLAVADLDGDSQLDVIVSHRNGWTAVRLDGSELAQGTAEGLAGWTVAAIEPSRGPSIVGWSPEKGPMVWAPGSGRWPFVAMSLSGREDRADSMRSNASGIGSRVVARIADRWAVHEGIRWVSGPGQSLQPIQIGLGKAEYVDYAEIHWSDGVYQSELELAAGEMHRFTETQRQLSSCPVLFAWNGQRWEFVTDLLGVGGMGYAVAPGEYAPPRPWENILFKEGALVPRAGRLAVKLSEPMEEVTYLDAARLVAWDLPPEWSMVLDERMGILGPEPTGRPLFYRNERAPEIARDGAGNDVTALVARADLQAPSVGSVDYRYIGLLEGEQLLELSFLEPLDGFGNRLALVVDGWVEYPYSQTNFAAWQAGKTYQAPTLEARGDDGQWHVVLEQWGYPAGMPRRMAVPLPTLPKGTRELRLRTNQEIYWDRVVVARVERCPKAKKQVLTMAEARLSATGYARRSTGDQRVPDYDYARRSPLWDTKVQEGWYTRFGAVDALVVDSDDAFAVFGPGEEVHLEFLAPQKGPADGWQRWWVLETEGWCKDMDLYTKDGATVEPLPAGHRGRKHVAGRQLHEAFATRYRSGLE